MANEYLIDHIISRLDKGIHIEKIQSELLDNGYEEDDIKEAFYYGVYAKKVRFFDRSFSTRFRSLISYATLFFIYTSAVFALTFFLWGSSTISYNSGVLSSSIDSVYKKIEERPILSNHNFFIDIKEQFISIGSDFIEADLSNMRLYVYKSGKLSFTVPIDSKGREGSWWETPAGVYRINSKEQAHFSSIGHVWMPWSLNFQGNFFIHGRTYYSDGTLTPNEFTGGCIRLSTIDAKRVYDAIDIGTPIIVFENGFSSDDFVYKKEVNQYFELPVRSYLSADLGNNYIFAVKNLSHKFPIASITKLMTALVATEYINLENVAKVPKEALIYTSRPRLAFGEGYTIYQLLFPLLAESSNEAAETIANYYGRERFIKLMNSKAFSIGMINTNFADPSGVSAENVSTVEDLFMLAKYIYNNRSFIFKITSGKLENSVYGSSGFDNLGNFNDLKDKEFFFGGKNGQTIASAETNLSVFELELGGSKRPVVHIVLGSEDSGKDTEVLLEHSKYYFR